ncbi:MAG TPA: hypothetical protein VJJ72_02020 [Candidatus Paceibacterota bacterium]
MKDEDELRSLLEEWAKERGYKIKVVRFSLELTVTRQTESLKEGNAFSLFPVRTDEQLTEEDWEAILSLPWKDWQKSIVEFARRNGVISTENLKFALEGIKKHEMRISSRDLEQYAWMVFDRLIQSINKVLKNTSYHVFPISDRDSDNRKYKFFKVVYRSKPNWHRKSQ